jgi:hypothetical protein
VEEAISVWVLLGANVRENMIVGRYVSLTTVGVTLGALLAIDVGEELGLVVGASESEDMAVGRSVPLIWGLVGLTLGALLGIDVGEELTLSPGAAEFPRRS